MTWKGPTQLHYCSEDFLYELMKEESLHYLRLGDGSLKAVLTKAVETGRAYRKFLKEYPAVMGEPLERYYLLRRATGKLDLPMLDDLLFGGSWREANWGAWLAALAPQKEYIELLERRKPTLTHGQKLINLALASCGKDLPDELTEHFGLLQEVRAMLDELPQVHTPMRLSLNDGNVLRGEIELVKKTYKSGRLEEASYFAKQGILGYYLQSYKEWIRLGAPSLSEWLQKHPAPLSRLRKRPTDWWKIW